MSVRAHRPANEAPSQHGARNEVTDAKLKRSAWTIGLVAFAVYVAFIAWNLIRARLGI